MDHAIDLLRADNGVLIRTYLSDAEAAARPSEVRVYDFDVPGAKQAFADHLEAIVADTHEPLPAGRRYAVKFRGAINGVVARAGTETRLFELPENAQALRDWIRALP